MKLTAGEGLVPLPPVGGEPAPRASIGAGEKTANAALASAPPILELAAADTKPGTPPGQACPRLLPIRLRRRRRLPDRSRFRPGSRSRPGRGPCACSRSSIAGRPGPRAEEKGPAPKSAAGPGAGPLVKDTAAAASGAAKAAAVAGGVGLGMGAAITALSKGSDSKLQDKEKDKGKDERRSRARSSALPRPPRADPAPQRSRSRRTSTAIPHRSRRRPALNRHLTSPQAPGLQRSRPRSSRPRHHLRLPPRSLSSACPDAASRLVSPPADLPTLHPAADSGPARSGGAEPQAPGQNPNAISPEPPGHRPPPRSPRRAPRTSWPNRAGCRSSTRRATWSTTSSARCRAWTKRPPRVPRGGDDRPQRPCRQGPELRRRDASGPRRGGGRRGCRRWCRPRHRGRG